MSDIEYDKTFQGAHRFTVVKNNQLVSMQYFYYRKNEALALFKEYLKTWGTK